MLQEQNGDNAVDTNGAQSTAAGMDIKDHVSQVLESPGGPIRDLTLILRWEPLQEGKDTFYVFSESFCLFG